MFALRVGSLMVLARLLEPRDFGLVAMVTVVTGIFHLFQDAGLSMVTIQRPTISQEQISTLFWVNMLVGLVLGLLTLVSAPILVSFYREPRLFWVTVASASGFLINAAGVQHGALLNRQMRFTALAVIETLTQLASAVAGIGMALAGFGYWSLVGLTLAQPVTYTSAVWLATHWVPGRPRRRIGIRSMLVFGSTVTLNSVVTYVSSNLEKVLLGRYWGTEALGLYGRAFQLINIPRENLNSAIGLVALSALSKLQDDPPRFRSYFLKGYSLVLALTMPVTIGSALYAEEIILVLLGPGWTEASTILRLLTPTVLVFGLINPLRWLLYSIGLVGRSLKMAVVLAPLVIGAYAAGLSRGPNGVAFAYSAVMMAWLIPHIAWSIHKTMISSKDIYTTASRPFVSACVAGAVAFAVTSVVGQGFPALWRLLLGGGTLGIVYVGMLFYAMKQKAFYLDLLKGLLRRPGPAEKEPLPPPAGSQEPGRDEGPF